MYEVSFEYILKNKNNVNCFLSNDNPCEPSCEGHFYVENRSRLTRKDCNGGGTY